MWEHSSQAIKLVYMFGEWEWERLLAEWGKSGHPRLRG